MEWFLIMFVCLWGIHLLNRPPKRIARTTVVFVSKVPEGIEDKT